MGGTEQWQLIFKFMGKGSGGMWTTGEDTFGGAARLAAPFGYVKTSNGSLTSDPSETDKSRRKK